MRQSNVELPTGATPEVTSGVAESTDLPFYGVRIPRLGELWCYDRDELATWFRQAADEISALPIKSPSATGS